MTLGFVPYGARGRCLAAQARAAGHELLLQVPMEPFDYPDNDPGPQTLLTSLTPEQNIDRLHWVMSQFQGYVGLANSMGARFTASETSFAPILHETAKRGLIFVDDGSNPRSVAGQIAGANNLPFARADVIIDAVPTPGRNRPRAGPSGNGRARAQRRGRHRVRAAGIDRANRQMGEVSGEPRPVARPDHRGGDERQAVDGKRIAKLGNSE